MFFVMLIRLILTLDFRQVVFVQLFVFFTKKSSLFAIYNV